MTDELERLRIDVQAVLTEADENGVGLPDWVVAEASWRVAEALDRVLALRDEQLATPATTDDGAVIVQCGLRLDRALRGEEK